MKKFLTLVVALVLTIPMMAIGRNDGSAKSNAIDFDWEKGVTHTGGTKWYRVDLAPLYEEENPSLTLYLTNPSNNVGSSVDVSMQATVAGQSESKDYTISARQYKTYTANASMLIRMKQTEIYLTLTSTPNVGTESTIKLSAKVFEAADLDETCKDARTLTWGAEATQNPTYSAWWKVSLKPIKDATNKDAQITITNTGSKTVTVKVGQSLDCPSSGMTKREYELAPGQSEVKKVPRDMIMSVQPDELYFGIENVESQVSIKVETVNQPIIPVIPGANVISGKNLLVTDTIEPMPTVTTLYKISVADMDSMSKYEPEFTYRNVGTTPAKVIVKMAFSRPAYSTSDAEYDLAAGEEQIVVYKKNMLEGMEGVDSIYLLTTVTGKVNFYGRFKHVREGKACKTNIDFNWASGHSQEARTTQWYAIDLDSAKNLVKDVVVYVENQSASNATVKASMAFSCPYIDLQEVTRTVGAGQQIHRRMPYSTYAMMSDTVFIGLETNQDIKFWAELVDAEKKAEADTICLHAIDFNWEEGVVQNAEDTVWYRIDMTKVRDLAAKFPTVFVQNLSSTAATTIKAELSLECPDSIENESRSLTIAANESYSKQLSRNMFENIKKDTIYLRVISTQDISLQIRLTEEAEGASCSSAIPFNWVSGNTQGANENVWYSVDLRNVMKRGNDLKLHIENKANETCKGVIQLSYECPVVNAPSIQEFTLAALKEKAATVQNSALETVEDSIIYVNLQGTTGLRIWADTLAVEHFDTIFSISPLKVLQWDTIYTQTEDTVWYIIPQSEIDRVRNLDEKVKPVAHLWNLGTAENTYKVEAAFAFPIVKKMMTKSQKLGAGKHYSDTIPASTFDQFLKKDSIIICVTRPVGSGDFQFRAELVKAFSGNKREDALPIRLGEQYTQSPMTTIWYKINTADWKKDKNLYNRVLNVMSKNAGAGDAKVNVAVFEGLLSETDMLEEYGLGDYRERTLKKGQGKSHNVPAQAVYALGDVELYIQVQTTDSLVFATKFGTDYAPQAVDPKQAEAKLVVPNVEYVVPGDNQEHWYMVCIPYIRNNYKYIHAASLTYELNGPATIEGTATLQDNMDCAMPVRKRTINRSGGHHKGTKPLWELINKAIKKGAKREFDVSGFQEDFVDEMLRRYLTSDSITAYVRIKTDTALTVKLNMPQTTGDDCGTPMAFDWEHGNVNPAGAHTWYHVYLDSLLIPDTCDLRIHVDNWSTEIDSISADLHFNCNEAAAKSKTYKLAEGGKDSIDIDRDFLALSWSDLVINYYSDKVSHIWAELIPSTPRDTVRDTVVAYVCYGEPYIDSIRGAENYKIVDIDDYKTWYDTLTFKDGVVMKDSVTLFQVHPVRMPVIDYDTLVALDAAPLLVQGMELFVDSSKTKLTEYYRNLGNTEDTVMKIDTIYWALPVWDDKDNFVIDPLNENPLVTRWYDKTDVEDTLLLVVKSLATECDQIFRTAIKFPIEAYKYGAKNDTLCPPIPAKNPDTLSYTTTVLDTLNRPRYVDTIVTYVERVAPILYKQSEINLPDIVGGDVINDTYMATYTSSLQSLFDTDAAADALIMAVTGIKWQVKVGTAWQDLPYSVKRCEASVTMHYIITTECTTDSTSEDIVLAVTADAPTYEDVYVDTCDTYTWPLNGTTYTSSTTETYTEYDGDGCDLVITTLHLTLGHSNTGDTAAVACDSFTWYGKTYTTSGTDTYTFTNVSGCDSVVTLTLTINHSNTGDTTAVECNEFTWHGVKYTESTSTPKYTYTNAAGCDSVVTLHLTIYNSDTTRLTPVKACNMYNWKTADIDTLIVTTDSVVKTFTNVHGCDSVVALKVTINVPYVDTLEIKGYYGDRIIMINRNQINEIPGWELDSLGLEHPEYVVWYEMLGATPDPDNDKQVATGYYYTLSSGEPLPAGTYYAYIDLPASAGAECGAKGVTKPYTVTGASAAPALVPSLARPGEDVQVINLDPTTETIIRVYTTEGLLQATYKAYGETSYTIKAASDHGFYLVELSNESMKSTLRYIVK